MKKLLFVINHMNIGGIQVSLLDLLNEIHSMYDITLLCIKPEGELLDKVPSDVKILKAGNALLSSELSMKEARLKKILGFRLFFSLWSRFFSRRFPAYVVTRFFQKNLGIYDVAISYTQPIESKQFYNLSNEVALYSCTAEKKITFLHCDFQEYGGNDAVNRKMYLEFDRIAAVSESVGNKLIYEIPEIKHKVVTVYNCCNINNIKHLAEENSIQYEERFPVVTVARLSPEKGLERCVKLIKKLSYDGVDIKWHIIGEGICRKSIEQAIEKNKAEDIVILHGQQKNPYRYIKNAKLFLLPSYHEAAPMVYKEAACLGVPILTTETTSAEEIVSENGLGVVCGIETEDIFQALKRYTDKENVTIKKVEEINNSLALSQFVSLIEK